LEYFHENTTKPSFSSRTPVWFTNEKRGFRATSAFDCERTGAIYSSFSFSFSFSFPVLAKIQCHLDMT